MTDDARAPSGARTARPEDSGTVFAFLARHEETILGWGTLAILLGLWEAAVYFGLSNPLFTSSPTRIFRAGYAMFADGSIYRHLAVSGLELFVGYSLAIVVAVPVGILFGWYRRLNACFDPIISALYVTPRIALVPLIVIWFGIGLGSKFAIVFLGAIFPILINTIAGVRTVDRDYIKVGRSFGANDWQMFTTVVMPAAVPFIITGLRLGLGHALIGIVVGELYAAQAGIGYLIAISGATFQTDRLMVGIIIIAIAGVSLTGLLRLVERRFDKWRPANQT